MRQRPPPDDDDDDDVDVDDVGDDDGDASTIVASMKHRVPSTRAMASTTMKRTRGAGSSSLSSRVASAAVPGGGGREKTTASQEGWAARTGEGTRTRVSFATKYKNGTSSLSSTMRTTRKMIAMVGTADATIPIPSSSKMMWIDKYAPRRSSDLCVPTKKVDEVRDFLFSYIDHRCRGVRIRGSSRPIRETAAASSSSSSSSWSSYAVTVLMSHPPLPVDPSKQRQRHHPVGEGTMSRDRHNGDAPLSSSDDDGILDDNDESKSKNENDDDDAIVHPPIPPALKLMILIGAPGIGKSAMVRALASDMNIEILSWDDAQVEYNHNSNNNNGLDHYYSPETIAGGEHLPYQSRLDSFDAFLTQGGAGMTSLDMLVEGGGGGGGDDGDIDNGGVLGTEIMGGGDH